MRLLPLVGAACFAAAQTFPRPVAINGAAPGLAFDPAFAFHPGGGLTFVWNAYEQGREQVFFAGFRKGRLDRPRLLSPGPAVYYQPVFAATGPRSEWAVWMRQNGRAWRLVGRELRNGEWAPVVALAENALAPAISGAEGRASARPEPLTEPRAQASGSPGCGRGWSLRLKRLA